MASREGNKRSSEAYRRARSMGPDHHLNQQEALAAGSPRRSAAHQQPRPRSRGPFEAGFNGQSEQQQPRGRSSSRPVTRTKSIDRGGLLPPPTSIEAQAAIDEFMPRIHPPPAASRMMPLRQKSMIDLRGGDGGGPGGGGPLHHHPVWGGPPPDPRTGRKFPSQGPPMQAPPPQPTQPIHRQPPSQVWPPTQFFTVSFV